MHKFDIGSDCCNSVLSITFWGENGKECHSIPGTRFVRAAFLRCHDRRISCFASRMPVYVDLRLTQFVRSKVISGMRSPEEYDEIFWTANYGVLAWLGIHDQDITHALECICRVILGDCQSAHQYTSLSTSKLSPKRAEDFSGQIDKHAYSEARKYGRRTTTLEFYEKG